MPTACWLLQQHGNSLAHPLLRLAAHLRDSLTHFGHQLSRHAACHTLPLQCCVCDGRWHQEGTISCKAQKIMHTQNTSSNVGWQPLRTATALASSLQFLVPTCIPPSYASLCVNMCYRYHHVGLRRPIGCVGAIEAEPLKPATAHRVATHHLISLSQTCVLYTMHSYMRGVFRWTDAQTPPSAALSV